MNMCTRNKCFYIVRSTNNKYLPFVSSEYLLIVLVAHFPHYFGAELGNVYGINVCRQVDKKSCQIIDHSTSRQEPV